MKNCLGSRMLSRGKNLFFSTIKTKKKNDKSTRNNLNISKLDNSSIIKDQMKFKINLLHKVKNQAPLKYSSNQNKSPSLKEFSLITQISQKKPLYKGIVPTIEEEKIEKSKPANQQSNFLKPGKNTSLLKGRDKHGRSPKDIVKFFSKKLEDSKIQTSKHSPERTDSRSPLHEIYSVLKYKNNNKIAQSKSKNIFHTRKINQINPTNSNLCSLKLIPNNINQGNSFQKISTTQICSKLNSPRESIVNYSMIEKEFTVNEEKVKKEELNSSFRNNLDLIETKNISSSKNAFYKNENENENKNENENENGNKNENMEYIETKTDENISHFAQIPYSFKYRIKNKNFDDNNNNNINNNCNEMKLEKPQIKSMIFSTKEIDLICKENNISGSSRQLINKINYFSEKSDSQDYSNLSTNEMNKNSEKFTNLSFSQKIYEFKLKQTLEETSKLLPSILLVKEETLISELDNILLQKSKNINELEKQIILAKNQLNLYLKNYQEALTENHKLEDFLETIIKLKFN